MVRELTEYGVSFSFSAAITDPVFGRAADIVRAIPEDRLLIESDAPDMLPYELRGAEKSNEPANLIYTAAKVAEFRGMAVEDVAAVTAENAKRIFVL
jgi:TatD DNase family protein